LSMAGIPPAGASLAGVHKTRVLVTQSKMGFDGEFSSESDQYCSPFTTLMQVGEVLDIVQIYYARDHTTPLWAHRGKRSTSQRLEMTNLVETSGRPDAIFCVSN
jgi:hypothetical protein